MPATAQEIHDAISEGVELIELAAPVALERNAGNELEQVVIQRMRLGEPDESGRRSPQPIADSTFTMPAEAVIMAVSQSPVLEGLESLAHQGDWLVADAAGAVGENMLSGGDALGLGIAGNAIVQGRRAAESLHLRLSGEHPQPEAARSETIGPDRVRFLSKDESRAVHKPELPPGKRIEMGMAEVAGNISEQQFLAEAQRCYSCGSCFGCEQCLMYCTKGCFTRLEEPRPGMYFTLNLDECQECGKCVEVCPCGFLEFC
jgi:formate dehydrogenase major subunit